tara:strand:+ start:2602 stop:2877 length:276 start_codon:yes stop_codon:yes gene_type:complete
MKSHDSEDDSLFCNYISDRLNKIYDDYKVVNSYVDDYDKYGAKRVFECANGWIGWSWDLNPQIKKVKMELYNDVVENGTEMQREKIKQFIL